MIASVIFLMLAMCLNFGTSQMRKEVYMSVPQLVAAAGYPVEKHRATTEDGYILQLHRIPSGRRVVRKSGPSAKGKKAVLLCSGLLGSSGDFVIMGPQKSLAYILADAGYDVWLANLRGDIYTAHKKYNRTDKKFWQYGIQEHGVYDLPASIDKVLNVTGLPKLLYIGYSMGTTSAFIMLSERPEYNDKLISYVALAPAVYMTNIKPLVESLLKGFSICDQLRAQGWLAVNFPRETLDLAAQTLCSTRNPYDNICMRVIFEIVGNDEEQYDPDQMPLAISRLQPVSFQQFEHFGKIAMANEFTAWENGLWGLVRPYDLTKVKTPVSLIYGENDKLTEKTQIYRLAQKLNATGALEDIQPVNWPKFNHLDFAFAKDVGTLLNEPLVKHIKYLFSKYG